MTISIVGCGPGGADYLPPAARTAVCQADAVLGSRRLLAMFDPAGQRHIELPAHSAQAIEVIEDARKYGELAVLVSGDPGLFSLAQAVLRHFGRERCRVIPGISSVQAAFAAVGINASTARVISAHARIPHVSAEELADCPTVAILAGTRDAIRWGSGLAESLAHSHRLFVCENLTLPDQRITQVPAGDMERRDVSSRTVLLLIRSELL